VAVPGDHEVADAPTDGGVDGSVARRPFPQVPNTSGVTLGSPTLVTIVASNDALLTTLPSFSDALPSSQLWALTSAEYGLGSIASVVHIVGPALSGAQTTAMLASYVTQAIAADAGPAANGKTIYLVYLPDGATFAAPNTADCGYHGSYPIGSTLGDQITAVQRCAPDPGGETQLGQLTRDATHQIVESATDPLEKGYNLGALPATPWTGTVWQSLEQAGYVELGDLCEGTREFELQDGGPAGGWEYQRIWSNAAALDGGASPCVPQPTTPYFSSTVPMDWYALSDGGTLAIPVGGWSDGTTSEWRVRLDLEYAAGTGALAAIETDSGVITTSLGPQHVVGCLDRSGMNDGVEGSIAVSTPVGVASGDYAVFKVFNYHIGSNCDSPLTEDNEHFWPVGVYVP
jgi:hypothetical protein